MYFLSLRVANALITFSLNLSLAFLSNLCGGQMHKSEKLLAALAQACSRQSVLGKMAFSCVRVVVRWDIVVSRQPIRDSARKSGC